MFGSCSSLIATQGGINSAEEYVCLPCGSECDKILFHNEGICAKCHMPKVKKSTVTFTTLEPSNICAYMHTHPNLLLLDVRTKEEYERDMQFNGVISPRRINIPLQELNSRFYEINNLKDSSILVYCSHSHRSPQASYLLGQHGFSRIINMNGGLSALSDTTCFK